MRQGILIGVRPKYTEGKLFPRIPLGAGSWRIVTEFCKDTKLRFTIYDKVTTGTGGVATVPRLAEVPDEPSFLTILGPAEISAEIIKAGNEEFINVYASPLIG